MKMIAKLTVLFAALFLLTGVVFADCYEVTYTNVDDPSDTMTFVATIELDTGHVCSPLGNLELSLFFDSMSKQALGYNDNCWGFIKFHGEDFYILDGISFCDEDRYTVRGHKTDAACPACACSL